MPAGKPPSNPSIPRPSSRSGARALAWLALAVFGPGASIAADEPSAPSLCAVEVRVAVDSASLDLESLVEPPLGEPVDPAAVRRTLANAHATGWFRDVGWWQRPGREPGCVEGVLVLEPHPRVREIEIVGDPGLRPRTLRRAVEQPENAILDPEAIRASEAALLARLADEGYFEARVESELLPDRRPWQDLRLRVQAGPRARIATVAFEGDRGFYGDDVLREALAGRVREPYSAERARDDVERLREFLVERGHYQARVEPARVAYDPGSETVDLVFPVEAGPVFELELVGAKQRRLARRGYLPFLGDRPFDEALFTQSCARLRRRYQEKGHFRAAVECEIGPAGEEPRSLRLAVTPGPEFEIESVSFPGAERVSERRLRSLVSTSPGSWWTPGSGRLVGAELDADLERLRSYYYLEGFFEAVVGPASVEERGKALDVEIPIEEGPRRRVVSVAVKGSSILPETELLPRLPLRPGSGYHPLLLEDAVNLIRTLYEEEGYPSAVVTPELDWDPDRLLVDVVLAVEPGPKRVLDRLVLRGLQHTRPELVRRFAALESGEPLSRRRLLEAERDLYRLGIFSEVDVDLAPSADPSPRRDVRIRLREGRRWRLAYGVSYHSDDGIGGLFGLTRSNLRGRGERLQLDLRASENDQRLRLIYDQPSLGAWRLPVTYTLFGRLETRESYEVRESGARVSLTRDLARLRLGLVYDYRFVELAEEVLDPTEVEREDSEVEISSLAPNLFVDRRDDPLDPRRGWSTAVQLEYAFPLLGADAELLELFWQQTQYLSLGDWGTLAGSVRLGLIEPLSRPAEPDPIVPEDLPSSRVPISERFFAGGRTTHRAYERDRLGVLGESLQQTADGRILEAGGNGLLLLNLDYRFPISGPVEGVTFFDLGNVWADWRDVDLGELRPGLGLGVRYASPVGPIRLEIGWKLDPQPFEDSSPVFLLSFGNPF